MKNVLIAIAALLGFGGILYLVMRRKPDANAGNTGGNQGVATNGNGGLSSSCITIPAQFARKWSEEDGWFHNSYLSLRELDYSQADADPLINDMAGFFKAIDRFPTPSLAKHLKTDVENWLANGGGKHWEIKQGSLGCK